MNSDVNDTNLGVHSVYDTPEDKHIQYLEVRIRKLTELLRDEWNLRLNIAVSPWKCRSISCPYSGKPMVKTCNCFREAHVEHAQKVKEAIK